MPLGQLHICPALISKSSTAGHRAVTPNRYRSTCRPCPLSAFGRFIESTNPLAFWARAMQMAWLPWCAAARAVLPSGLTWLQLGLEATTRSEGTKGEPK
jgi:hypothetical protein